MDFISQSQIQQVQQEILTFYENHGRDLPWRRTTDPYPIMLSEFMLQQTQVNRVVHYYTAWLTKWSTIFLLAETSFQEVLKAWMGLGYNRRAKYLHETCNIIVDQYDGDVLTAMKDYKQLPGIGLYTARAVRIFAGNEDIATVDTNIRRILIHVFNLSEKISDKDLFLIAERCVPKGKSCVWHNALMDYGALNLTARRTGIKPKTQQSTFHGSDRQIRGQILRLLLKEPFDGPSLRTQLQIDEKRLETILEKMIKEHMIIEKKTYYTVMDEKKKRHL